MPFLYVLLPRMLHRAWRRKFASVPKRIATRIRRYMVKIKDNFGAVFYMIQHLIIIFVMIFIATFALSIAILVHPYIADKSVLHQFMFMTFLSPIFYVTMAFLLVEILFDRRSPDLDDTTSSRYAFIIIYSFIFM